jgi:hypothetical protein
MKIILSKWGTQFNISKNGSKPVTRVRGVETCPSELKSWIYILMTKTTMKYQAQERCTTNPCSKVPPVYTMRVFLFQFILFHFELLTIRVRMSDSNRIEACV